MKLYFPKFANMNSKSSPFKDANPFLKIVAFIFILLLSAAVFSGLGMLLASIVAGVPIDENILTLTSDTNSLIIMQIVSAIGMFIIPVFVYTSFFEGNSLKFLRLNKTPSLQAIFMTIVLFFLANFVLDLLVKTMHLIPFETMDNAFIKGLLQAEIDSEITLKNFLDFSSPLKFLAVFFMMAVLPGISEELTFRGVFMNLFQEASKNQVFAIVLSGFVFAVIHVQLHNFLAIFFMGMMLGTIYYLTKNLWVSILAHLFNNGLIVVMSYLSNLGFVDFDFSKTDDMPLNISIFGTVLFFIAFYFYREYFIKRENLNE